MRTMHTLVVWVSLCRDSFTHQCMANVTTSFMKVFTGDASRSGVFEDEVEAIIMVSCIHGASEDWLQRCAEQLCHLVLGFCEVDAGGWLLRYCKRAWVIRSRRPPSLTKSCSR